MAEWDRLPVESTKAYAAFTVYRDLGPDRSLAKTLEAGLAQNMTKARHVSQLKEWSRKNQWVSRAEAYDAYLERQARKKREKEIADMLERHGKLARAAQAKAVERLNSISATELSAADLLRYIVEAAKLERLSMGEPETTVKQEQVGVVTHQHKLDLSRLTDGELEELDGILGKATEPDGDTD